MLIGEILFFILIGIIIILAIGAFYYMCIIIGLEEIRSGEKYYGYFLLCFPIFITLLIISGILIFMGV
jgi:hypothetical protein